MSSNENEGYEKVNNQGRLGSEGQAFASMNITFSDS